MWAKCKISLIFGISFSLNGVTAYSDFSIDNAKQLTRYLGLSPTYQLSGTSVHVKGHINRNGDPGLRSQLYVAAFSSLRCNTECKACFDRLRSNGKPGKVAVIAVANKLIRQAFAVVTQGKPYVDGFKSAKPWQLLRRERHAARGWAVSPDELSLYDNCIIMLIMPNLMQFFYYSS